MSWLLTFNKIHFNFHTSLVSIHFINLLIYITKWIIWNANEGQTNVSLESNIYLNKNGDVAFPCFVCTNDVKVWATGSQETSSWWTWRLFEYLSPKWPVWCHCPLKSSTSWKLKRASRLLHRNDFASTYVLCSYHCIWENHFSYKSIFYNHIWGDYSSKLHQPRQWKKWLWLTILIHSYIRFGNVNSWQLINVLFMLVWFSAIDNTSGIYFP